MHRPSDVLTPRRGGAKHRLGAALLAESGTSGYRGHPWRPRQAGRRPSSERQDQRNHRSNHAPGRASAAVETNTFV